MTQFLIRRIFWAIFLFFAATIITYLIFWVIPADPAALAAGKSATPADIARVRHFLHLDEPIWQQYLRFVWNLVGHGSLGQSFVNRQSVDSIDRQGRARSPPRSSSAAPSSGSRSRSRSGSSPRCGRARCMDRVSMMFVLIGISAHPVWIGLILSYVFGFRLGLTPIAGYCNFFTGTVGAQCEGPVQWAYHLILPWITFMILFAALYVRLDPRERDGDDERGLRAHRPRQGRVRAPRDASSTSCATACSRSSRSSAWTSASRSAARSSPRSIFNLPGLGHELHQRLQHRRPADDHRHRRLRDDRP